MSNCLRLSFFVLAMLAAIGGSVTNGDAQGLTGQIAGTVLDSSKAVIPGATVSARNTATQVTREAVTDGNGEFVLTNLLAGNYDIRVSLAGFKTYEQTGVALSSTQRLALAPITLEIGGLTDTVTVASEAAQVQTQSGERSASITASQIQDLGLRGRDFMGALKSLPGVIDTSARDAPGWGSVGNMTVNGQASFNFSYDGVTNKDTGSNSGNYAAPALDSIAEVKVQASNFQAEYGRSSGATITVVTKSGSRDFRGSAAYYLRDDALNSNTWERKRSCDANPVQANGSANPNCNKPFYRYDNTAWTIGGPVLLPGSDFNRDRDKLFFFFSQDLLPRNDPGQLLQSTMPTELERVGNFSQTVNSQGNRIWIKDPALAAQGLACSPTSGGPGCFENNIIPANRLNPFGQLMLNRFPLPNAVDETGNRQFNYLFQNETERSRHDQVARVDWNVRQGTTYYTRVQFGNEVFQRGANAFLGAGNGIVGGNANWPQFETSYEIASVSFVNTLLHSFSPTTVLEITAGVNWARQSVNWESDQTLQQNTRAGVLNDLPQFFPEANPLNLIPQMFFGGTNAQPNTRFIGVSNRFPFNAKNILQNYSVNLTKLAGSHNLKGGLFIERTARPAPRVAVFNGSFSFNANQSNPFDTNFGFANALLGSIDEYQESTAKPFAEGRFNQIEFFVQDNWRVRRNFTLDYGARFYYNGHTYVADQQVAFFDPAQWSEGSAPVLFQPVCPGGAATCAGNVRQARNPLTGEILNNTFIGKLVPGTGDFYNGMQVVEGTVYDRPSVLVSPRVGFAWDVTGDGRTAVRGGAGIYYDRYTDDTILQLVEQPPLMDTRTTNWTTIPQLLNAQLVQSPRNGVQSFAPFKTPTVYNWSVGVQRELPFRLVGDIAYVGNANRNTLVNIPLNNLPLGATRPDLSPQNLDPTQNNTVTQTADYLRQFRGVSGINQVDWKGYANYHSIQASVERRFANGFGFSVAYTGAVRRQQTAFDPFLSEEEDKRRNYNKNGSRPHNLVVSYNYQVPDGSGLLGGNAVAKGVLDGWQVSGVSTFQSGTYTNFTYTFTGAPFNDMVGGGFGGANYQRVTLTCDPTLPRSERTDQRQFRTECVTFGGPTTTPGDIYYLGGSTADEWRNLGYVNHDLTLFKNFAMGGQRRLQVRVEMYNVFNTVQFGDVDTSVQYNFTTGAPDAGFGSVTSSRNNSARVIQLGARFTF